MSGGDLKINRIKRDNNHLFSVLDQAFNDAQLELRNPDMHAKMNAMRERKEYVTTMDHFQRAFAAHGQEAVGSFKFVAGNVDPAVWKCILDVFARYDEEGNQMDDGLLFKTDIRTGDLRLNRDFFYALLSGPLAQWDMRGKIRV